MPENLGQSLAGFEPFSIEVQFAGRNNVPADATASILNLGIDFPEGAGFATL